MNFGILVPEQVLIFGTEVQFLQQHLDTVGTVTTPMGATFPVPAHFYPQAGF